MRAVLYNGTIVHEHSQLAPFHEITMCYDINKDLAYTPMEVMQMPEGERAGIVTGTVDDVVKYGDDYVICDKKTYNGKGYVKNSADEMHQLQINIYNVLLEETFDIKSKYGCVLYLDKSKDLKETPVVFELAEKDIIKQYLRDTMESLRGLEPPIGTICYLCNGKNRNQQIYCNYVEQCERDGNRVDKEAAIAGAKLARDNKIKILRNKFKKYEIDGYIVPKNDEFFSEYAVIDRLKIISNFSGSAGLAVVLRKNNYLFVDGRYTIQAQQQSGKQFKIIEIHKFLPHKIIKNLTLGFDPSLLTRKQLNVHFANSKILKKINKNLIDEI